LKYRQIIIEDLFYFKKVFNEIFLEAFSKAIIFFFLLIPIIVQINWPFVTYVSKGFYAKAEKKGKA
jgi:hypothetical protein